MNRELQYGNVKHETGSSNAPLGEFKSQITDVEFVVLAHLNSGIRWGTCRNKEIIMAPDFPGYKQPEFSVSALQQLRVFNAQCEFFAWRTDDSNFDWRVTRDVGEKPNSSEEPAIIENSVEYFDEETLLWGTHVEDHLEGFTLLREGVQGMRHTPPLPLPEGGTAETGIKPVRLVVRHYLNTGNTAQVVVSRLVKLKPLQLKQSE